MAVERRKEAEEDLNLTPIMNLVTILIPFLIMSAEFVQLAVIDSTLPAIGPPQPADEKPDKPPLSLSLAVTDKGVTILGADTVLYPEGAPEVAEGEEKPPTLPCKKDVCTTLDDYKWEELTRKLGQIKDEYPDDENVIIVPASDLKYEVIVKTMDSSRDDGQGRDLFPYVVIAGGAM